MVDHQKAQVAKLTQAAQQGDEAAFNELYLFTRDRAYFLAVSIVKNENDAMDILQDSYLNAWKHLNTLPQPEQFECWFGRITGNAAKNFLKKRRPLLFDDIGMEDHTQYNAEPSRDYIPDQAMDNTETQRIVHEILQMLPEDQRLCVLMRYYNDMPVNDIAQALEVPAGTVMSRLGYARKKIGSAVEALEKQGVKLFSAAPLSLLIYLLRTFPTPSCNKLPATILGKSGIAAGVSASSAAGIAATTKIAAACIAVAATVAIGVYQLQNSRTEAEAPPFEATEQITANALSMQQTNFDAHIQLPPLPTFAQEQPPEQFADFLQLNFTTEADINITATQSTTVNTTQSTAATATSITDINQPAQTTAITNATTMALPTTTAISSFDITTTESIAEPTTTATAAITTDATMNTTTAATTVTAITTTVLQTRTLTDAASGISIEFREDLLPENVEWVVQTGRGINTLLFDTPGSFINIAAWRIEPRVNGVAVQPGGNVTVRIPAPESFAGDMQELRVELAGQLMDTRAEGRVLVFETNLF